MWNRVENDNFHVSNSSTPSTIPFSYFSYVVRGGEKKTEERRKKHFGTRKALLIPHPSTRWVAWENDILFLDSNDVKAQSGIFSEYSLCVLFSLYRVGWENHSRILFRSYQMVLCSRRYKDVGKWILFLNPFAVRRGFYESDEIMNVEASSKPSALFIASKCPHYIQI